MKASPGINSFNAGELSPLVDSRTDLDWYRSGCKTLSGFIPLVQGPAIRCPGTKYVSPVNGHSQRSWLGRFVFNSFDAFILEFGEYCIRLYQDRSAFLPGAYDNATEYSHGQFVTYGGAQYQKFNEATDGTAGILPTDATNWALTGAGSAPITIQTLWNADSLIGDDGEFALRIAQTGDILYITHSGGFFPPAKVVRYSDTRWAFYALSMPNTWIPQGGPFNEQNTDESAQVIVSVVTDAEVGSGLYVCGGVANFFTGADTGVLFQIEQENLVSAKQWEAGKAIVAGDVRRSNGMNYEAQNNATTGTVKPAHIFGTAYDGDTGVQWLYQDAGFGIVEIDSFVSSGTKTVTGAVNNGAGLIRLTIANHGWYSGFTIDVSAVGGVPNATGTWEIIKISANTFDLVGSTFAGVYTTGGSANVPSHSIVYCTVRSRIPDNCLGSANKTHRWSRSMFSNENGWPENVTFFRERLTFSFGRTLLGSVAGDFDNFATRDESGLVTLEQAWKGTIALDQADSVNWISPDANGLLVGTTGAELLCSEMTSNQAFGPGNIKIEAKTSYGSRGIQPERCGESAIFVQRSGRKTRAFQFTADGYSTRDLSVRNDQITIGGVVAMAWQQEPWQVLWCVTDDGRLLGMTFNAEQEVTGWSSHPLGGTDAFVESIQCIPSPTNDRDDLYMIVRRTINGSTKRYIEVLMPEYVTGDDIADAFYVKCGLTYDGAPATTISGLGHLEGKAVAVLADGVEVTGKTVSGGAITLSTAASVVHVGLPYTSTLQTMRLEAGAGDGTAQGKTKRIHRVVTRLFNTKGGRAGPSTSKNDAIPDSATLFTGDRRIPWPSGYETDAHMCIIQSSPYPMTVLGIYPQVVTQDG